MSYIINFTDTKYIKWLEADNKFKAIEEVAGVFEGSAVCTNVTGLITALKEREEIMSTGIGFGIAIPHAKIESVKEMAFAVGISKKGINFDSMDGNPVYLIILVAAGEKQHKEYLKLLSSIMGVIKKDGVKNSIINAADAEEVIDILRAESQEK
jgi:mannitol/fructose-specific phosphotransferase system IIA component (Ntr-type)